MLKAEADAQLDEAPAVSDPGPDGVIIRRARTPEEYDECVRIQDEIWGAGFKERVPSTIFKVTQYLGGVTAGAFSSDADPRLLGFVFGMTGVRAGRLVHWSDLLAVRPEARDRGLGRRLKLYQRSLVLPLGVTRMQWTFDPLVAKNAHFNLNALGVRVTEYVTDLYGTDTGSSLHSAVGTDRMIALWDLERDVAGAPAPAVDPAAIGPVITPPTPAGSPAIDPLPDAAEVYIQIPRDIHAVIAASPAAARQWRQTTRAAFVSYLRRGYEIAGFQRVSADGSGLYRLTRREAGAATDGGRPRAART